jgi:glycosyltransferase involved in cell wall biosynthesis
MAKISLILATVDKEREPKEFFDSLSAQTFRDIELVVVDQNSDSRISSLLKHIAGIPVKHLRCSRGLSRARNAGIKAAAGDILAFPDDDCKYGKDLLARVAEIFEKDQAIDGIAGMHVDEYGRQSMTRFKKDQATINKYNIWNSASSATIFIRKKAAGDIGYFDESLGVGAGTPWGAGEEIDFLLQGIEKGHRFIFMPDLHIYHPQISSKVPDRHRYLNRIASYSRGRGRVIRMHSYPFWFLFYTMTRYIAKMIIAVVLLRKFEFKVALSGALGECEGLFSGNYSDPGALSR